MENNDIEYSGYFKHEIYCRLCLDGIKEENATSVVDNESLNHKVFECVSIKINADDIYSKYVCQTCIESLDSWACFKKKCQICQEALAIQCQPNEDENVGDLNPNNVVIEEHNKQTESIQRNSDIDDEVFEDKIKFKQQKKHDTIQCQTCGVVMLKASWRLHQNLHNDKFKCEVCSKQCLSQTHLHEHVAGVHKKSQNQICHVCAKIFATSTSLQIHLLIHSDQRKHRCNLCDYAARTSSNLQAHMATHAQDSIDCHYCEKSFKSVKNLRDHVRRIHKLEKIHECSYCGKKFTQKYVLETHLRIHTGLRPYKCTKCCKGFSRKDSLNIHERYHEQSNS